MIYRFHRFCCFWSEYVILSNYSWLFYCFEKFTCIQCHSIK